VIFGFWFLVFGFFGVDPGLAVMLILLLWLTPDLFRLRRVTFSRAKK
jgi:hypothetical protein